MSMAFKGLEETMKSSMKVVETCLRKKAIHGFIDAGNTSKDLDRVYFDILANVNLMVLANSTRQFLIGIENKFPDIGTTTEQHDAYVRRQMQENRESGAHIADGAVRSMFEDLNGNVPAAYNMTPHTPRGAKYTPANHRHGQGHPHIVTKMIARSTVDVDITMVTSVDMHPWKPWIVMGDMGGSFCIWDYEKKETVIKKLVNANSIFYNLMKEKTATRWFCSVKFITRENWLVVGDFWGNIYVYQYTNTTLSKVKNFMVPGAKPVELLAVHPTKSYLLSSYACGTKILLWDWSNDNWKIVREFDIKSADEERVLSLKFDPRDSNSFACFTDKRLMVGNINSCSITTKRTGLSKPRYFFNRTDRDFIVNFSPSSHNAEIWDLEAEDLVATLGVSGRRTRLVAGVSWRSILVTVLDDGTVCFWDGSYLQAREQGLHYGRAR